MFCRINFKNKKQKTKMAYILFTFLFIVLLAAAYTFSTPALALILPGGLKNTSVHKLNFFVVTALTVATLPIGIHFANVTDTIPANAGWNRKATQFIVTLCYLFFIAGLRWFVIYFYEKRFFQLFEDASPEDWKALNDSENNYPSLASAVWGQLKSTIKLPLLAGYVATMVGLQVSLESEIKATGRITYAWLPWLAGIFILFDIFITSSAFASLRNVTKSLTSARTRPSVANNFSYVKLGPVDVGSEIFSMKNDPKTYNTKIPSHRILKHIIETGQLANVKSDNVGVLANVGGNTANGGYFIGSKRKMMKALGPFANQAHQEKFALDTGGEVTCFSLEHENNSSNIYMNGIMLAGFTVLHLVWSILFLEDITSGVCFWVLSNFIPVVVACYNPHAWVSTYVLNQLTVMNLGWLYDVVIQGTSSERYLFGNMGATYWLASDADVDAPANVIKIAAMDTLLETTDVIVVYAFAVMLLLPASYMGSRVLKHLLK